jgi:predicted TIM-barrel fold metal-dependent hydrolase
MSSEGPESPSFDAASSVAAAAIRDAGVCDGPDAGLNERLGAVGLVDHHVHGTRRGAVDEAGLADMLIESDRRSAAEAAGYETQVWHAVRRWCAPLMGLEPYTPAASYVARRLELGPDAVATALLPAAGFSHLVVETGFRGDLISSPAELSAAAGGVPASRVVRLEALAERLIAEIRDPWTYPGVFRAALAAELAGADPAVGFKTILAYRGGFDRDLARPTDEAVARSAAAWSAEVQAGAGSGRPVRLTDDALLRFGIWSAVDTGRPLQVHSGFGDPDLDLHRADPLLLTGFLRATEGRADVLLLHAYPFQRGAGYLAQMFPHVYLDVGLAINYAGAASAAIVSESMELAPFRKLLFSSDGWGAPELHLLGSWLFRRAMARLLGAWVARGDWSRADAERVIDLVAGENARRVYGLG